MSSAARAMVEASLDAIVTTDDEGAILRFNARAEALFGWSAAEARGRHFVDLVVPSERREIELACTALRETVTGATLPRRLELVGVDRRGRRLDIELSLTATRRAGRTLFHGFMRDVSELRRLRGELVHAQKMELVGRKCSELAHDFNNTLTVISSFASLAAENLPPADPGRADMKEILTACAGAARLTRQLLTFSRKEPAEAGVVDAAAVVQALSRTVRSLVGDDITVHIETPSDPRFVRGDSLQVERLVTNLVANARDAMPNGGSLSISTATVTLASVPERFGGALEPGRFVVLRVSDTGSGIDADVKEHIFEPFFTTKDEQKGTGLGLATVFEIARKSGGHVTVESTPGQGTTFEVYFPALAETTERRPRGPQSERPS